MDVPHICRRRTSPRRTPLQVLQRATTAVGGAAPVGDGRTPALRVGCRTAPTCLPNTTVGRVAAVGLCCQGNVPRLRAAVASIFSEVFGEYAVVRARGCALSQLRAVSSPMDAPRHVLEVLCVPGLVGADSHPPWRPSWGKVYCCTASPNAAAPGHTSSAPHVRARIQVQWLRGARGGAGGAKPANPTHGRLHRSPFLPLVQLPRGFRFCRCIALAA
jgi:hypothetical protein